VRGDFTHIDLLEVDLKQVIESQVAVELTGVEEAPGVVQGGVLDQVTRELNVEALPTDIPDSIVIDVSHLELNETYMLSQVTTIPSELTVLDDAEETVIATVTPPSKAEAPETVEEETELVGEGEEAAEGAADADSDGDGE
jgi:large subunit ribosomal protein L25